jgi:hypothetical protein
MSEISLTVPEEALVALKLQPDAAGAELRLAAAAKLYELGRLSSGAAASLAGVPRTAFLSAAPSGLPERRVSTRR